MRLQSVRLQSVRLQSVRLQSVADVSHLEDDFKMNNSKLENIFGKVLKNLRLASDYSQEKLALDCELDRTYISMLERGKRQPTLKTIFTLCDKLNCSPSEMVKLVEVEVKTSP